MCLIWTFPILADSDLQQRLNQHVFDDKLHDFRRQPDQHDNLIRHLMAQGRAELVAQSPFNNLQSQLIKDQLVWATDRYISFLRSQANGALLTEEDAAKISQVVGMKATVLINNHIAVTLAFK